MGGTLRKELSMSKKRSFKRILRYWPLYLMLIPGTVYLIINNYIPLFGLLIAFKKVDYSIGILKSPWTGFSNFTYLFATNDAFIMFRNTILYNVVFIILGNLLGFVTAIAMDTVKNKFFKNFSQVVILIPYLEIVFGPEYEVIPVLVLKKKTDYFEFVPVGETDAVLPVCSGDMLFNAFDEYLGFLDNG